jgi:transposase
VAKRRSGHPEPASDLARIIRDKSPLQFKFEYALGTLPVIREPIRDRLAAALSGVSLGRVMRRIGFTPQRPLYRAWQQDSEAVQRWRAEEYPKIAARAKHEGAVIFFEDESDIPSDHHAGTTRAPRGQTPVVRATGARYGFNMMSAVDAQGHIRFMLLEGRVMASVSVEFPERLRHKMERKVFLIVDGHPTHKAPSVQRFVEADADRIEPFVLPPYSPETSPDELAWAHVKARIGRAVSRTEDELKTVRAASCAVWSAVPRSSAAPFTLRPVPKPRPEALLTNPVVGRATCGDAVRDRPGGSVRRQGGRRTSLQGWIHGVSGQAAPGPRGITCEVLSTQVLVSCTARVAPRRLF